MSRLSALIIYPARKKINVYLDNESFRGEIEEKKKEEKILKAVGTNERDTYTYSTYREKGLFFWIFSDGIGFLVLSISTAYLYEYTRILYVPKHVGNSFLTG